MGKSKLRALQDYVANAGWRIQLIPYDDPSKPIRMETNWLALVGMLAFIGGVAAALLTRKPAYAGVSGAGFIFALLGLLLKGRMKRRSWIIVKAACLDRETRKMRTSGGARRVGGWTWAFRLICQFDLNGQNYTVTPSYWRTFRSEESVDCFFAKTISGDGICALHVNPHNPLETEFVGKDVKDFLLH